MKKISIVLSLLFSLSVYSQDFKTSINAGFIDSKIENSTLFVFSCDIYNVYFYIGSTGTSGNGKESKRNNIPDKAVLSDKKIVSTFGLGYAFKMNESFYFVPYMGAYATSNIYEYKESYYTKGNKSYFDTGMLLRFKKDYFNISVGSGLNTNFTLTVGVNF